METEAGEPLLRPIPLPTLYETISENAMEDYHTMTVLHCPNRELIEMPLREEDSGVLAGFEIVPDDDTDDDMPGLIDDPSGVLPHARVLPHALVADSLNWTCTLTARHSGKGM